MVEDEEMAEIEIVDGDADADAGRDAQGEGDDSVYISEDEDESTQQRIDSARQLPPILLRVMSVTALGRYKQV